MESGRLMEAGCLTEVKKKTLEEPSSGLKTNGRQ